MKEVSVRGVELLDLHLSSWHGTEPIKGVASCKKRLVHADKEVAHKTRLASQTNPKNVRRSPALWNFSKDAFGFVAKASLR